MALRSDRLFEVDWRLAELERAGRLSAADRDWVRLVLRSWDVWQREEGGGPVEFVWASVAQRARRLLVSSWR